MRLFLFLALLSPCWGAVETVTVASLDGAAVLVQIDQDSVTGVISRLRIANTTANAVTITITNALGGSVVFSAPANTTRQRNIAAATGLTAEVQVECRWR